MAMISIDLIELKNMVKELIDSPVREYQHIDFYTNPDKQYALYNLYKTSVNDYIHSTVLPALSQKQGEMMLRELVDSWENYNAMVKRLHFCFSYLDRHYIIGHRIPTLGDVRIKSFFNLVYREIKNNTRDAVIALIEREREGEQIEESLLKNVMAIFVEIGMGKMDCYLNDYEVPILEATGVYYSRKAASWIIEDSCPEYLLKVEECLQLEKLRASHILHSSRETQLLEKVQNELLVRYENQILEKDSGLWALLRDNKKDDLSRMFKLFSEADRDLDPIANTFKKFAISKGTTLLEQAKDPLTKKEEKRDINGTPEQEFVLSVIEMHHYVLESFQNHALFQKVLHEAFQTYCSKGPATNLTAELLSAFSDNLLKKSSTEKLSDDDIDPALENLVKILSYFEDKDLFAEFYREKLARRLLVDRSPNDRNEWSMFAKLKQQNGPQFTSKMEHMVSDFSLAKKNQNKFVTHLNIEDIHVGLDLSVTVLTTCCWPTYKSPDINLPTELDKCIDIFEHFYSKEISKYHKLTWMHSLGSCIVEGQFNVGTIEMVLSTYQAALLMLFNESEKLTYDEIKSKLNLKDDDANRVLHSLACANDKVLIKNPNTEKIAPTDYFEINPRFAESRRIKIPLPQSKVIEDMEQTRKCLVDAAIVHIMKTSKVLDYDQLQHQCINRLELKYGFKPEYNTIMRRIDGLIERGYIERDRDCCDVFKYLKD